MTSAFLRWLWPAWNILSKPGLGPRTSSDCKPNRNLRAADLCSVNPACDPDPGLAPSSVSHSSTYKNNFEQPKKIPIELPRHWRPSFIGRTRIGLICTYLAVKVSSSLPRIFVSNELADIVVYGMILARSSKSNDRNSLIRRREAKC